MPSKRKFSTIYFGSNKSKKSKDSDKDSDIADGDIKNLGKKNKKTSRILYCFFIVSLA